MKYLSACLSLVATSLFASTDLQECLVGTDMNPGERFSHEVITTLDGDYKVVNDAATGLQWSYCFIGQSLSSDQQRCEGTPIVAMDLVPLREHHPNVREKAMELVERENQRLGETSNLWHLPNIHDLLSIYNQRCVPAYYPMFSHHIGLTAAEIAALKETRIDYSLSAEERQHQAEQAYLGNAYDGLNVSTDSNIPGEDLYFYALSFSGRDQIVVGNSYTYSMLRLVRKQAPKSTANAH
ncbi:hypothetical protein NL53_09185 [Vibrio variabilis]|uniref:Uncharacterized protein n=1 Tax=Vibrio variabilis TaxID=990271 RepID=A0ABR4YBC6_9VIBR|nr:DUF1566 domain-containing protein [Vibrio variabilis]KHA60782.1 hypothetical protein NL53_09185 [Vibrio variabilis]